MCNLSHNVGQPAAALPSSSCCCWHAAAVALVALLLPPCCRSGGICHTLLKRLSKVWHSHSLVDFPCTDAALYWPGAGLQVGGGLEVPPDGAVVFLRAALAAAAGARRPGEGEGVLCRRRAECGGERFYVLFRLSTMMDGMRRTDEVSVNLPAECAAGSGAIAGLSCCAVPAANTQHTACPSCQVRLQSVLTHC